MGKHAQTAPTKSGESQEAHGGQTHDEGLLVASAKKIGAAAGGIVSLVSKHEAHPHAESKRTTVNGKYPKSTKSRMPRRLKKAMRKQNSQEHAA